MLSRLGDFALFRGDVTKGVFRYPTDDDIIRRSESKEYSGLNLSLRNPEIFLFSQYEHLVKGEPLRVLCGSGQQDFIVSQGFPTGGALIRVELVPADEIDAENVPGDDSGDLSPADSRSAWK